MFSWRLLDKSGDEDREDEIVQAGRYRRQETLSVPGGGEENRGRPRVSPADTSGLEFQSYGKLDALNQRVMALTESIGRGGRVAAGGGVGGGGVGYQTTTLKPIIRIPMDLPLDGEEAEGSPVEPIYRPVWENTTASRQLTHSQPRAGNSMTSFGHPLLPGESPGATQQTAAPDQCEMMERHDFSIDSNTVTEDIASSSETLTLQKTHQGPEPHFTASSSETDHFADSSAEEADDRDGPASNRQKLLLNVSTDSSSGGANSSKEEYRHILDDENYHPYRDTYRDSFRDNEDKYSDDRDSEEEYLGISDEMDTDYAHDFNDSQPRELDSDEELFCCNVLEPIMEEDSDDLTTSSDSTDSSRSGKACYDSRHREHEYDLEYEERKHGLVSDRQPYTNRLRSRGEHDTSNTVSRGVLSSQQQQPPLLLGRPSTAVPSSRRHAAPPASHLPGRARDPESSRFHGVNTAAAPGPDDDGDNTGIGVDDGGGAHALEENYGGSDESRVVFDPRFKETDLDASDSHEDNSNFPSEEEYVNYIRSYGSSVDRLTGKLKRQIRNERPSVFPHSQPFVDSDGLGRTQGAFSASQTGQYTDRIVPDKAEESNSESDESVQTVITRQTSTESGDSPVHGPSPYLRPTPVVKTKRPLSDGAAYANKKLRGEGQEEEAYFRDRYVSEGGGYEEGSGGDDAYDNKEDNIDKYDLRAYKSYAALDSEGLRSPVKTLISDFSHSDVLKLTEANSNHSENPLLQDTNSTETHKKKEDSKRNTNKELNSSQTIDSEDPFLTCDTDSVDSKNVQPGVLKKPGNFAFLYSQFSREEDKTPETMNQSGYSTRTEDSEEARGSARANVSEEWDEQIIEETFIVPMTPERAILKTLQSVKDLLDKRSEMRKRQALGMPVEDDEDDADDECQSTCTATVIEVDGYGAAGFETYDAVDYEVPEEQSGALVKPISNVDIKTKLGFQLNLDEYKTDDYNTESGWPIVRYIEKERVYIDEDGLDEHQVAVTVVDSSEARSNDAPSEEEMETNIDDVEEAEEEDESEEGSTDEESEEEDGDESGEESEDEKSGDGKRSDDKDSDAEKKNEKYAFVECKDERLQPPFATLQTPITDRRADSQRTYFKEEQYAKVEYGAVKSPTTTLTPPPYSEYMKQTPSATPENYKPTVTAEMRAISPPPIEMFKPSKQSTRLTFPPENKTVAPSTIPKNEDSVTIQEPKSVTVPSISGLEKERKKLIDSEEPYEPFDDFNSFLNGVPASSEPFVDEDYDAFVRHISEKDDAAENIEQDTLKTPLTAAGILSGNLASPYTKQDVFSFPAKETVRPVPLARKHSLKDKKPEAPNVEDASGESDVKKAKLKRTSTAQSEEDFSLARRASVGSQGDEESVGALNRSFEETSSRSFALERYDSEPGVSRSVSRESLKRSSSRDGLESPTADFKMLVESPMRNLMPMRPLSGVSQEPDLDVVLEVPVPALDGTRSQSSSSADPTTPATPSAPVTLQSSPIVVSKPVPQAAPKTTATPGREKPALPPKPTKLEAGPVITPPPVKWTRVIPGSNFVEEKMSPNTSANIVEDLQKKFPDTPERKLIATLDSPELERPELMGLEFADADEDGPELFSPSLSIDRFEIKMEETPKVRPVLEHNALNFSVNANELLNAAKTKDRSLDNEDKESEEMDESESEEDDETDTSEEYEDEDEEKETGEEKNSLDDNDNLVFEENEKENANLIGNEDFSEKVSKTSTTILHSTESKEVVISQTSTPVSATTSPGKISTDAPLLTAKSLNAPLSIPFRGTAWAHAQFGQAPAKPRTMKEIKKKFKPYKSILTQGPTTPTTPTTPPSPKITPFSLPDHLLTPSRLKIIQSRNRFLSEQNLTSDPLSGEFQARKEALQQQTAPSTPQKERKYTPKGLSGSSKYRSQEQLEKIMNMINLTRRSESLTRKSESNLHTAHLKCMHSDCIFTEKGRREIMDKALSIDNIHCDLYRQLQELELSDYLDHRGIGDAFFPETNSDLFDLTFPFQDDRRQVLDRPASMSELRHASDYTTISGSGPGVYDTPTSKSGKNRFANRPYKKSKSLCTLETNIDDDHFGTSPTDDGLQRVPSVHELRISKSLQKLNVPNWYKQSSLSKSGSCLLKYGSSSTMSSWQMSPSLISSPCTTPSTMSNVVIKTRVQPPTSARNLRSPRYPSKSAPTTPLFDNQSFDSTTSKPTTPTPVKLPSEQLRSKEKSKSLMPIPIVPFDKIRAMFEKKKEDTPPHKRGESPASPTSPVSKPQTYDQENLPSPKKIGVNGNAEEEDFYDDVVPKVIVSPSDPNVKSILKRPGQEKRYSDIAESPEPDEEPIILKPVPTRPAETSPTLTLPVAPVVSKPLHAEPALKSVDISPKQELPKPVVQEKPIIRPKPIPPARPKSSEIKSTMEIPSVKQEEPRVDQKPTVLSKPIEQKEPIPPPSKPKGFSFFRSLRSSSSSSTEDVKNRKSPISPNKSLSPNSSYESDNFTASPAIRLSPSDRKSPPGVTIVPEPVNATRQLPTSQPISKSSAISQAETRTKSPDSIQETNIDDSFELPSPTRTERVPSLVERTQSPTQEADKKRSWFPKAILSKSKSPTESEKSLPKTKPKVSELQSKFEVPEFAQEPRRLTSSRGSSVHNESFTSNDSDVRRRDTTPISQKAVAVEPRSTVRETDLDRSIESNSSRPSTRSRDLGLDYSRPQRKTSDTDSGSARDSDKRDSDRGSRLSKEDKPVLREPESDKDTSFSSKEDERHDASSDKDYDEKVPDYDRRDKDYDRRNVDSRDKGYVRPDSDYDSRRDSDRRDKGYDRDYDKRDRRDRDFDTEYDRREKRDKDYDRDYDKRDKRDKDYDRDYDKRDKDYDRDYDKRDKDYDRDYDKRDKDYNRDYDRRDKRDSDYDRAYDRRVKDYDKDYSRRDRRDDRDYEKRDDRRKERDWSPRDPRPDLDRSQTSRASSRDLDTSRDSRTVPRRPSDNDDAPKLRVAPSQESVRSAGRTWQPKPRGSGRSSVSPQARDISPTKPVDSNGTSSRPPSQQRYPVPGSAFSATKPNALAGLNTPPLSRHDVKPQSSPSEPGKSLKETTV